MKILFERHLYDEKLNYQCIYYTHIFYIFHHDAQRDVFLHFYAIELLDMIDNNFLSQKILYYNVYIFSWLIHMVNHKKTFQNWLSQRDSNPYIQRSAGMLPIQRPLSVTSSARIT